MHRSGTSAVAGAAVRLGLAAPLTQLTASDDNPGGFYESAPVVEMNHRLLLAAGCAWNLCMTLEPDSVDGLLTADDRRSIARTLRQEFGAAPAFVLKDPRLCLTLPAWLPALRASCDDVVVLIVARHPAEVARSLARRNGLPDAEAAPLWLHHMLEAERLTRGLPRAVVLYDELLVDWRAGMRRAADLSGIVWPKLTEGAGRDIDLFLDRGLRHHSTGNRDAAVGPPELRDMIAAAWVALRRLRDEPRSPMALPCLEHVRRRFADWRAKMYPPGFRVVFAEAGQVRRAEP